MLEFGYNSPSEPIGGHGMITVSGRFKVIRIALVTVAFFFLIIGRGALAQTNPAAPGEKVVPCNTEPVPCQTAAQCCQPAQSRHGIVSRINRFLGFGCRLNYRIDDWILSDKRDVRK
jgi:hypothetical protein